MRSHKLDAVFVDVGGFERVRLWIGMTYHLPGCRGRSRITGLAPCAIDCLVVGEIGRGRERTETRRRDVSLKWFSDESRSPWLRA
jgi:hypothetical protein